MLFLNDFLLCKRPKKLCVYICIDNIKSAQTQYRRINAQFSCNS